MALGEFFDLSGRNAIVTGGGSGLGRHFAEGLAEAGANLVLCARHSARCEEAAAELRRAHGVTALGVQSDVREPDNIHSVVELTKSELGSIDILVNNASTSWGAPVAEYPLEGWRKVIDVNLTGSFIFAQAVGREMIAQGRGGKIVNVASVAAFRPAPPEAMDAIAPTRPREALSRSRVTPRRNGRGLECIPLRRFGAPDDLKGTIVPLTSPASNYVTGHTLVIDGDQSIS